MYSGQPTYSFEVFDDIVIVLRGADQRRYKDKNGQWQSSGSFNRNEIPLAIHCLQKAFDKIIELQNEDSGNGNNGEEVFV